MDYCISDVLRQTFVCYPRQFIVMITHIRCLGRENTFCDHKTLLCSFGCDLEFLVFSLISASKACKVSDSVTVQQSVSSPDSHLVSTLIVVFSTVSVCLPVCVCLSLSPSYHLAKCLCPAGSVLAPQPH